MRISIIYEKCVILLNKTILAMCSVIIMSLLASVSVTPYVNAQTPSISVGPQPPTSLTANTVTPSSIALSWTAPTAPDSLLLTGYKIERSTDSGNTWSVIVTNTNNTTTTYTDTALASGTTYTYRVSTITPIGTSSPSNTASATTPSVGVSVDFATCCYGDLQIQGSVSNPISGINQAQLLIYAPNGNLVLDKTEPASSFQEDYEISRTEDKGSYVIVVTYDNSLSAKTEIPS